MGEPLGAPLHEAVRAYLERDAARLHMPGHKGRGEPVPLDWDITEVEGADSLYHARGPILALEERLAAAYGAARTLVCAGGATLCIQTMLALACKPGGEIVMSRNLHRSAINAVALLGLEPVWIYPDASAGERFLGRYPPNAVREALAAHPNAQAVYLTSPDYFGVASDLSGVAAVCEAFGVPLLVDNAHGAHLKFLPGRYGPLHPMDCGAAMCADSLHKTMPAMTGAAALQIGDARFAAGAKRLMAVFGSTSPSYPILLSCETALLYAENGARAGFSRTAKRLQALALQARDKGLPMPLGPCDPAKLSLCFAAAGWDAARFGAFLRENGIEPEYLSGEACVLMATDFNRQEDFCRVERALRAFNPRAPLPARPPVLPRPKRAVSVRDAVFSTQISVPVENAAGRIAAADVSPCPPGIPLVMPGELIGQEEAEALRGYGVEEISVLCSPG